MKIAIYHGYELKGSGSNEYTRYLASALFDMGHDVQILCREWRVDVFPKATDFISWDEHASFQIQKESDSSTKLTVHQLPHASVRPVYLTDQPRDGVVKSFVHLTPSELKEYHDLNVRVVKSILSSHPCDVFHANHLIYQPTVSLEVCAELSIPWIIFPHGSSIEYVIREDQRYFDLAKKAILGASGLIIGNREVTNRILNLYPDEKNLIEKKTSIVSVGVSTRLFRPIERSNRLESIEAMCQSIDPGGKPKVLSDELNNRLGSEPISIVQEYRENYNHSKPDQDIIAKLKGVPWEENVLLFVGSLTVGKGVQSLIAALPGILKQLPRTHLVIAGQGAYREVLEAMVFAIHKGSWDVFAELIGKGYDLDSNDLSGAWEDVKQYTAHAEYMEVLSHFKNKFANHVHFTGRLDHGELKNLFPCADLAIFPSLIPEAYPLVLLEALSNGVLPMASYFSGFKDGLDSLKAFLPADIHKAMKIPIEPSQRISTISTNIVQLLTSEKLSSLSKDLRKIAEESFDWSKIALDMTNAYEIAIKES